MRIRSALLGTAALAALTACGTTPPPQSAPVPTFTTTQAPVTTTTPAPTTTTTTTTTTVAPTTTTTTTITTTQQPKPTTTQPKPTTQKPAQAEGAPCKTTARACIDLSSNQSWLLQDGKVVYGPVKITHGRKGWETPPGTFKVAWKNRHHKSRTFNNAPMPFSVFFNGGIAFHQGSLSEKSHGCIHLSKAAASKYFSTLKVGDVVQVVV